jgi:predicted HTH transcriptional regulator
MANIHYDEETINSLIENQERENLYVDYKSAKSLEKTYGKNPSVDISKDVSAFANAAGGCILYGVEEKKNIPIDVDGTIEIEDKKEWLNRVINGNIVPRIEGIEIYAVRFEARPGKAVLVVSIPMSHTAHQAKDKRYYHRYDEESLPMDDYQVRQTMYRGIEPNLILKIALWTN